MHFYGPTGVLALCRVGRNGAQAAQAGRYQRRKTFQDVFDT